LIKFIFWFEKNFTNNFILNIKFLNFKLDSPLQKVVDDMMKMNQFDYNKMLEELELMEIRDKNKKEKVIKN